MTFKVHNRRSFQAQALITLFAIVCASCQLSKDSDMVVAKSYIHRYGVEVPSEEWVEQGQSGQVVEALQNGVTVTKSYRDGLLEGPVSYTFPHRATIERLELYADGVVQQVKTFYPSGHIRQERELEDGFDKKQSSFYENSSLRCFEVFDSGRLVQGKYYTLDHAVESEVVEGEGRCIQRDPFGQLLYIDTMMGGYLVLRTLQHPNGMPKACYPYANNKVQGIVRTYMPGGDPLTIEQWVEGEQHGLTSYYAEGECVGEAYYDKGKRVGVEKRFADEGSRLVEETTWFNGERHGPSYTYLQGQRVERWYFRGKEVQKGAFDHMSSGSIH